MDKIKVSKEVAIALEVALKVTSKRNFFEEHSNKMQWTLEDYLPLNKISNWDMAQILINGYEVEETPEDRMLDFYNYYNGDSDYEKGFRDAVEYTLEQLRHKIKGIND